MVWGWWEVMVWGCGEVMVWGWGRWGTRSCASRKVWLLGSCSARCAGQTCRDKAPCRGIAGCTGRCRHYWQVPSLLAGAVTLISCSHCYIRRSHCYQVLINLISFSVTNVIIVQLLVIILIRFHVEIFLCDRSVRLTK